MRFFQKALLLAVLPLAAPAIAEDQPHYRVILSIVDGGRVVGTPTIILAAGKTGSVSVSNAYRADILVNDISTKDKVALSAKIAMPVAGEMVQVASPSFTMKLDQTASMETISKQTSRALRVEATVSRTL